MSFGRRIYDVSEARVDLNQRTGILNHVMDLNRHYNCSECRIPFGVTGGNDVSRTASNPVDVESDLMGLTRLYSKVPSKQYLPKCMPGAEGMPEYACKSANSNLNHLSECSMISYKPHVTKVKFTPPELCPNRKKKSRKSGKARKHRK